MISLEHLLIDERVLEARFACDLAACKGACCTLKGGGGAPLRDEEVELVRAAVDVVQPYLGDKARRTMARHDVVEGHPGSHSVACIDDAECVFVVKDTKGVAKCSIEQAWHDGKSTFRKPISCHLFPIRIADFGGPYLYYDEFEECEPGRALGEQIGTPLVAVVHDALVRAFGEEITGYIEKEANP